MARTCGIRVGARRYELVVLDGSAKKHKILAYHAGELPPPGEDAFDESVDILKVAAKEHRVPKENVHLAVDTGTAAFRRLLLPFADRSKIGQVVKYEIEGELPQWNIDDVIVDFHVLRESEEQSELLVSAVPKAQVRTSLELCERAGVEPLDAEFETSAMVNAAASSDLLTPEEAMLLVHVGEFATSVVVVDDGIVRDMRVIHLGGLTHEALMQSARETELEDDDEEGEVEGEGVPNEPLDPVEVGRRIDQTIKRIRRELGRTLSAAHTTYPITAIMVCGLELPGLVGSTVLDVPVYELDCFEEDGGQPVEGYGAMVVAYGAALRGLGPVAYNASLRREELRYSGAMERVEFPLAVAALLLCFLAGVIYILQYREQQHLDRHGNSWLLSSNNYLLHHMRPPPQELTQYQRMVHENKRDPERDPVAALQHVSDIVNSKILERRALSGDDADVGQPQSAFVAMCLVLGLFEEFKDEWRPSFRRIDCRYQPGSNSRKESVKVSLTLTFFAQSDLVASGHYNQLETALKGRPWFVEFDGRTTEPIEDGKGISVDGLSIIVNTEAYFDSLRESRTEGEAE